MFQNIRKTYISLAFISPMVQAIITLGEKEDRIVNIVKAQHGFKNKSEAINLIVSKFHEQSLDDFCPVCDSDKPFKPEYIAKMNAIRKEKALHRYNNVEELRKAIESA